MTPEEIVAILTTIGFQERSVGDYSPEEVQEAIDYAIDAVRQLNYKDIDNRTIGASSEIDDDREWLSDIEPYGYTNRANSFDKFTAEDWAYYLTSNWDWMDESDYYDLLDDINNLRGAEWVRDYEDDLRKLGCFEDFARFTNAYRNLDDVEGSSDLDNADSHDSDKEYYYQSKFPKNMVDALYDAGYLKKPWTAISPDQSVFNAMNQAALYSSDESLLSYIFSYNDEYGSRYLDKRFAMNDNVPEYILRDLYIIYSDGTIRGDYDELLVYVIKNPNTPLDIIQALAKSDSRLVRSNAEAELNK